MPVVIAIGAFLVGIFSGTLGTKSEYKKAAEQIGDDTLLVRVDRNLHKQWAGLYYDPYGKIEFRTGPDVPLTTEIKN